MIDELMEMLRELEGNDEFFEVSARLLKKMRDALVKAGFTPSEAIQIVASQGDGFKRS